MANNQNVNKVVYAGNTLIDLTNDDVTAGDVLSGKKFHLASGAEATGTLPNIGAISGILKGDGAGGVSAATAGTDYLAPNALTPYRTATAQDVIDAGKEAAGLGLTGASVGDLVRVNAVDANGKPTSWKKVALNEIKCNKNYLINHYMVGGGSQLGDGIFPINQRGQTTYNNNGYGIDMWYSLGPKKIIASGVEFDVTHAANSNNLLQQPINPDIFVGKTISLSALFSDNTLIYLENVVFNGSDVNTVAGVFPGFTLGIYVNKYPQGLQTVFRIWTTQMKKNVTLIDCKLELGPEQTLCHNEGTAENPIWVLNELPDYGEELRKCQRYYQLFRTESLRPTYGEDCRPTMATAQPTKGTLTKGGVTYYTLSSEP